MSSSDHPSRYSYCDRTHDFIGFRDLFQQHIGSLWLTRRDQMTPGREHRLVPIFEKISLTMNSIDFYIAAFDSSGELIGVRKKI